MEGNRFAFSNSWCSSWRMTRSRNQPRAARAWKRAMLPIGVLLLIAAAAVAVFYPRSAPILVEVDRSALESREGKLYLKGGEKLFTGIMTEHHPGGTVLSRSEVRDGVLHGLSRGFYTNGQVQVAESFEFGLSHGLRVKWRADGSKESEAEIVQGKLHGIFKRFHPNGEIAEEARMINGEVDGESKAFYPSGYLKALARLEAGKVLEQKFWKDGEFKGVAKARETPQ